MMCICSLLQLDYESSKFRCYILIKSNTMTRIELRDGSSVKMGSRKRQMTTLMASFSGFVRGAGRRRI